MDNFKVTIMRCEKVPEEEFDRYPEGVEEGWEVLCRKNGHVYIVKKQREEIECRECQYEDAWPSCPKTCNPAHKNKGT